jgi:hypothetical protein
MHARNREASLRAVGIRQRVVVDAKYAQSGTCSGQAVQKPDLDVMAPAGVIQQTYGNLNNGPFLPTPAAITACHRSKTTPLLQTVPTNPTAFAADFGAIRAHDRRNFAESGATRPI